MRVIMHTEEELEVGRLWEEIRKWFKINKSEDIETFSRLYPETYQYMKDNKNQRSTLLSKESLKRVGEVINRCVKNGRYIKTPNDDIIEYHYTNTLLNKDEIGASFHPDVRKGSNFENDFDNTKVEDEMFGKPILTGNQKDNRANHFWCDKPGCRATFTATNKSRHISNQHSEVNKDTELDPKDRNIMTKLIHESIKDHV